MALNSNKNKISLGRGLDSLISSDFDKSLLLKSDEKIEKVPINKIDVNPHQPRQHFDQNEINSLAESIKTYGIIQPLIITPSKEKYLIVAGERRWRAAKIAGLKEVPCLIRSSKDLERLEIALIENVQRVDLNPLEQATSIQKLHEQFSLSYIEIAKRLGKATPTINNTVRLLNLPKNAKDALFNKKISEGHARAILALKGDKLRQDYLLKAIIEYGWNVRQAERFVISIKSGVDKNKKAKDRSEIETPETKFLSELLKTNVYIRRTAKGGKIELEFSSDKELARLVDILKST